MALDHGELLTVPAAHTQPAPEHVVEARGLRRAFGSHVVLDGLELTIDHGEFVALLGRSGSGKSTLLRAIAGLDDETTGRLRVVRRRGVVFQDARLVPWNAYWPTCSSAPTLTSASAGRRCWPRSASPAGNAHGRRPSPAVRPSG